MSYICRRFSNYRLSDMQIGRLIINPMGGMANRMRAIASGVSLARDVSRELFAGDAQAVMPHFVWLKNWEMNAEFTDIFELPEALVGRMEYPSRLKYGLLYSNPRKKNFYVTALTCRRFGTVLCDLDKSFCERYDDDDSGKLLLRHIVDNIGRGKSCLIHGCTQYYPFDDGTYSELFRPTAEIAAQVQLRLEQLGPHKIGMHIRRTDNEQAIAHSPDELFIEKINEILAAEPQTRFYLATDDEQVKTRFTARFGNHIVTGPTKADRNSVDGIKEAAVEMFTLGGTDHIYGSYHSSFSEAAALIGQQPYTALLATTPG